MPDLIYAVRSVNGKEINKIYTNWTECKEMVLGGKAVYASFETESEAEEFIKTAPLQKPEAHTGYMPTKTGPQLMYGMYKYDIMKERSDGYSIRAFETQKGERFVCIGYHLPNNARLLYAIGGEFIYDQKFGYEFKVTSYKEHITDSKNDIISYLSCGAIHGIGQKKAEAIYKEFGSITLDVLEKNPEKLLKVKGISKNVLEKIKQSYQENKATREVTSFLLKYGISQKYAMRIFNNWGNKAIEKILENPYIICSIEGLTFDDAEQIAKDTNYPMNSKERFVSCAMYILQKNEATGDTGMEVTQFQAAVYNKLNCPEITVKDVFDLTCELVRNHALHVKKLADYRFDTKQYIFSHMAYVNEECLANEIIRVRNARTKELPYHKLEEEIEIAERRFHIKLDSQQKKAVQQAFKHSLTVITGGPGTGKTATTKVIDFIYKRNYEGRIIHLAPTGRAARKMTEATGEDAFTINSFLRTYEGSEETNEEIIIENALLIVDEFSMADVYISRLLFEAIQNDCKAVLIGDPNQLPSVGPGAVLRDIIESNAVEVIALKRVFRQENESQIYINCQKINNGDTHTEDGSDFHFHEESSLENLKHLMADKYVEKVKEYGLGNVMCLCPYNDYTSGVDDMNQHLQKLLNGKVEGQMEVHYQNKTFRIGDIVMHRKTNTHEVANGDIGFIRDIHPLYDKEGNEIADDYVIEVDINNHILSYSKEDMSTLSLAYAMSIYKSQGSEADAVITCLTNFNKNMLFRNIPYVAVSRGKKSVDVFGERSAWNKAIKNADMKKIYRTTLTKYFLQLNSGFFVSAS